MQSDSTAARTLTFGVNTDGAVDIGSCTDACFNAGYPLAGAEFADQCFCGLDFSNGGAPAAPADCDMTCAGNASEFCGGPNRLNVGVCYYIILLGVSDLLIHPGI